MSKQDITGDKSGGNQKKNTESNHVMAAGLKFSPGVGGVAVTAQNHRLVYPLRPLIAMHQNTATQPGQGAQPIKTETALTKAT